MAVKLTSVPRPKNFDLCRLAARSYTNMSATRILWDAKIFQYQLHNIRAFCHAFIDFQLWSRRGGWLLRLPLYQDQRTLIYADQLPGLTQRCLLPGYCGMQKFSNTSYMIYERSVMLS